MEGITATELKHKLDGGEDIQIIDVREPYEYELGRLEDSKLIPPGQVVDRMSEIDLACDTVLQCRGGVRSAMPIEDLRGAGFAGSIRLWRWWSSQLIYLKGDISAWSNEVDPSVPKNELQTALGIGSESSQARLENPESEP